MTRFFESNAFGVLSGVGLVGAYVNPLDKLNPPVGIWFSPFSLNAAGGANLTYNPWVYTIDITPK